MLENLQHRSVALPADAPARVSATTATRSRVAWRTVIAALVIALAVWLPRAFQLDHFVTIDESKWLVRSANYYQALRYGNLVDAFQHGHPGVMIMYAGLAGYLWQFPDYVAQVSAQQRWGDEFFALLESLGHQPIDLLAAGRTFVVIFNVIALTLAFLYARRLVGLWPALVAFLLIAFDPFHIALSRFLHPDSLLSTFMLLASLAFMAYLWAQPEGAQEPSRRLGDLIAAGAFSALALLTKTPAIFLAPLVGLLTLIDLGVQVMGRPGWRWADLVSRAALWRLLRTWLIWAGVLMVVYVALWPAMWVNARWTLTQVLDISGDYATQGHSSPVFFNGAIYNGDPGVWFYPINYLWRTTPTAMVGLGLLAVAWLWRGTLARRRAVALTVVGMLAFAFFFNIFMTLAAKKFDRYLLPLFMPLDFAAALGWVSLIGLLWRRRLAAWTRYAGGALIGVALIGVALVAQAGLAVQTYPYYMSYYNPVMGGPTQAENVMFIGWGEGLDQAARHLNGLRSEGAAAGEAELVVASWYERGPFSFFFDGPSLSNRYIWEADYSVIYNHQWQRELPNRRMMAYYDTQSPIHTVNLSQIDYVKIYDMRDAPQTQYTVEWGPQPGQGGIRLTYYDTFSGAMYPGQRYDMTMYFIKTGPLPLDYNLKVRMVNEQGHELLLKEGFPLGTPTSLWDPAQVLRDNAYQVDIPEGTPPGLYRIELSWYDPATFEHLPGVQVSTGKLVPDPYILDYLIVGDWPPPAQVKVEPPVLLGDLAQLQGAALLEAGDREVALAGKQFAPGASFDLRLHWRANRFIHTDYTTLAHVVGPDGALVTQADRQPMAGFLPTSYWPPRQQIVDTYTVQLPPDAPAGDYRLLVGWYDLATLTRLPMTQAGQPIGDAYPVATFTVR